jgi:hypothetical protein
MPHHKVAHRTETRGRIHTFDVHVAELCDGAAVVCKGVGYTRSEANAALLSAVERMHSDQFEALKEGL